MKFLLIAGYDASLTNFRLPLMRAVLAAGWEVVAAAPAETPRVPAQLAEAGIRFVPVHLARTGLNPLADWRSYRNLRRLCAAEKPDIVLSYTIKPVIYGSLAARAAGVPSVHALITGLGTAFYTEGLKGRLLRGVAEALYRRSLRGCGRVFVQNGEIEALFLERRLASRRQLVQVAGSGVDTEHFAPKPLPSGTRFLYLGRMLRDKGLVELAEAAAELRRTHPEAGCRIVGAGDSNPTGIRETDIDGWVSRGWLERFPLCEDVRGHLAECSVYVLPSYHEGMPRSVLEAMSVGRAIITTDTIGCRDTVVVPAGSKRDVHGILQGENGLLVPTRSAHALSIAMQRLASDPELVRRMAIRSRQIAVERFDVRAVNQVLCVGMGIQVRA
ncbi:MAG: glycosyltransferase family 4 protein [Opitutae bacterium]|nr:glycosyltransferase family 4 protein [Opitutae bacterium]